MPPVRRTRGATPPAGSPAGEDRPAAVARMRRALAETVLVPQKPGFILVERRTSHAAARRGLMVAFPIGAYDGFFGPGTGTFFALALVRWGRYDLLQATARAKILNLAANLAALAAFAWAGRLHWGLGLSMSVLSVAGHWVGSHLGLRDGARVIRPVVALVCAGLFAKILFDACRG